MSQVYNSIYTGNQIDSALGVIVDSGVSASHLQVLVGVTPGSGVANKALVLDTQRNFVNINSLSTNVLKASYLDLLDGTADPAADPAEGRKFLYFKNGSLWIKSHGGGTVQLKSGSEKELQFTNQTQVVVEHNFNKKYPNVIIAIGDKDAKADIEYTDVNTVTVSFSTPQSGTIICRTV